MAELKRAKRGKGRGKGKRVTFVEGAYSGLTEFSGSEIKTAKSWKVRLGLGLG